MTTVTSSNFSVEDPQVDGRCWVTENRLTDDGQLIVSRYLAESGADYQAHLDAMVQADNLSLSVANGGD